MFPGLMLSGRILLRHEGFRAALTDGGEPQNRARASRLLLDEAMPNPDFQNVGARLGRSPLLREIG